MKKKIRKPRCDKGRPHDLSKKSITKLLADSTRNLLEKPCIHQGTVFCKKCDWKKENPELYEFIGTHPFLFECTNCGSEFSKYGSCPSCGFGVLRKINRFHSTRHSL